MRELLILKMNALLAKTDHLGSSYKKMVEDYVKFFKAKQSEFRGSKQTYSPKDGTIDMPTERRNEIVVTTVAEKLHWLVETGGEYIDCLFKQEATNATAGKTADLYVGDVFFGKFSALELLRLKSILESGTMEEMYKNIPVRNDDEEWNATAEEQYASREIFESAKVSGVKKTTTKESYILSDPNINKDNGAKYVPQVASKDTVVELGDYTTQKFSGEWSHRQRAELLRRRTALLSAVIEALKAANDIPAANSDMTAQKLFGFLHTGKI